MEWRQLSALGIANEEDIGRTSQMKIGLTLYAKREMVHTTAVVFDTVSM